MSSNLFAATSTTSMHIRRTSDPQVKPPPVKPNTLTPIITPTKGILASHRNIFNDYLDRISPTTAHTKVPLGPLTSSPTLSPASSPASSPTSSSSSSPTSGSLKKAPISRATLLTKVIRKYRFTKTIRLYYFLDKKS